MLDYNSPELSQADLNDFGSSCFVGGTTKALVLLFALSSLD